MNIYFGDLHCHCGISYGHGSLKNVFRSAKEHLDFCVATGHAMWHDMPKEEGPFAPVVHFHKVGFKKLEDGWSNTLKTVNENNEDGKFVTFQTYEMHSSKYGDHHIVSNRDELPLQHGNSHKEIISALPKNSAMAILHHPGYTPGYRGANWEEFDPEITPVVEVFSKHGCGLSDKSPYNYYHTMGPRDHRSTVYEGLRLGKQFGFVGSTDHHAGFPASYGNGRVAVLAENKTRADIWAAIKNRQTYALTGDNMKCHFTCNGELMGSFLNDVGKRELHLNAECCDFIDKIVLYRNLEPIAVYNGEFAENAPTNEYKVRLEMGWGMDKTPYIWHGEVKVTGGEILDIEKYFCGRSALAPVQTELSDDEMNGDINRLDYSDSTSAAFTCSTLENPTSYEGSTQMFNFKIKGDENTEIEVHANGAALKCKLHDLLSGSYTCHVAPYNSEAIKLHQAVPSTLYKVDLRYVDTPHTTHDFYHVSIRQTNNQYAWLSPIFINS